MSACPKCGVLRRYVGVAYPVRRLCKCEDRDCGKCGNKATYVEFQNPIRGEEPKLPIETNQYARFSCVKHEPDDIPEELEAPPAPVPATSPPKKRGGRPHIAPVWADNHETPPPNSTNREKVVCQGCGLVHEVRTRVMWNGTESECPVETCRNRMYTHHWE